jgi:hypothetical protein
MKCHEGPETSLPARPTWPAGWCSLRTSLPMNCGRGEPANFAARLASHLASQKSWGGKVCRGLWSGVPFGLMALLSASQAKFVGR